jgi:hypothetical protein
MKKQPEFCEGGRMTEASAAEVAERLASLGETELAAMAACPPRFIPIIDRIDGSVLNICNRRLAELTDKECRFFLILRH